MTAVLSSVLFLVGARRGSVHARPFGARPLVRSHDDIRCIQSLYNLYKKVASCMSLADVKHVFAKEDKRAMALQTCGKGNEFVLRTPLFT